MGRTSKPLRIFVTESALLSHPGLQALKAQGHTIEYLNDVLDAEVDMPDLVMGPQAWFMDTEHLDKYLDMAIKAARAKEYPKGGDDAT